MRVLFEPTDVRAQAVISELTVQVDGSRVAYSLTHSSVRAATRHTSSTPLSHMNQPAVLINTARSRFMDMAARTAAARTFRSQCCEPHYRGTHGLSCWRGAIHRDRLAGSQRPNWAYMAAAAASAFARQSLRPPQDPERRQGHAPVVRSAGATSDRRPPRPRVRFAGLSCPFSAAGSCSRLQGDRGRRDPASRTGCPACAKIRPCRPWSRYPHLR